MDAEEDDGGGIPEWVVTFGDMMSLLLTFFIMLVSLSEIKEEEKYQAMIDSMRQQFGYNKSRASTSPGDQTPNSSSMGRPHSELSRAREVSTESGGDKVEAPSGDNPQVEAIRPSNRTAIGAAVYFDESSAAMPSVAPEQRAELGDLFAGKPQKIEIRGHSSYAPLPSDSTATDHLDLAFQRAKSAQRYLVEELGFDPARIRLAVAGPHERVYLGRDASKVWKNSRVEIYLLDEQVAEGVGTEQDRQQRFIPTDEL